MTDEGTGRGPSSERDQADPGATDVIGVARGALGDVYDPELGLDLVTLGLVYDVREEAGTVFIEMTLTTPGCPAAESLPEIARAVVATALAGAAAVEVTVVWEPPWSPTMMSERALSALGLHVR